MIDSLVTRLADRRCPACATRQPLYVTRDGRPGFLRAGSLAVPCPGCGLPLYVRDSPRDPHGIAAAVAMVLGLTGLTLGTVIIAAEQRWPPAGVVAALVAEVAAATLAAIGWTLWRARGRVVEVAGEQTDTAGRTG